MSENPSPRYSSANARAEIMARVAARVESWERAAENDMARAAAAASVSARLNIEPEVLYRESQAARILGLGVADFRKLVAEGRGPVAYRLHPGAPLRYRGVDLAELFEQATERVGDV